MIALIGSILTQNISTPMPDKLDSIPELNPKANPWQTHSSTLKYTNPWIDVRHHEVTTPGGSPGIYGKVHFKNIAVGVIPLDKNNNTWIVGQYRYTLDQYSWEIPEGGCPMGEEPLEAIKRELKEETGLTAHIWEQIMTLHTSNSVTDEVAYLFVARDLKVGMAQPEDAEQLKVRKLPFSELIEMVHKGKVTDAMSVAAVLKLAHLIETKS